MKLKDFNIMNQALAKGELLKCCGSENWADQVIECRPFENLEDLKQKSTEFWLKLSQEDWLEAFKHHPRIGESTNLPAWAKEEQSGIDGAPGKIIEELLKGNKAYESKFGHVFLICASEKSAPEILSALNSRLDNNADQELKIAVEEQRKITDIRLDKLFFYRS